MLRKSLDCFFGLMIRAKKKATTSIKRAWLSSGSMVRLDVAGERVIGLGIGLELTHFRGYLSLRRRNLQYRNQDPHMRRSSGFVRTSPAAI